MALTRPRTTTASFLTRIVTRSLRLYAAKLAFCAVPVKSIFLPGGGSGVEVGRVQPALGPQAAEVVQGAADPLDQRGARHRPQVALQGGVVQVVGNGDLPLAEGDQPGRRR